MRRNLHFVSTDERNGVKIPAMSTPAYQCESTETAGPTDHEDDRRRATRDDAPVPDEHVETNEEPVPFHPLWIPRTSTLRYVDGQSALNLRSRQIGGPGDWHGSLWWCPVEGVPWACHFAFVSDAGPYAARTLEFAGWLGEEELVDAREALIEYRHPGAERNEPVHCTTHVRAILRDRMGSARHHAETRRGTKPPLGPRPNDDRTMGPGRTRLATPARPGSTHTRRAHHRRARARDLGRLARAPMPRRVLDASRSEMDRQLK